MNFKLLLSAVMILSTLHAESQTGTLTFNNTLNQPVLYSYITKPSNATTVKGGGEIASNTTQPILSSFKQADKSAWGDTINFELRRNQNESFPIIINQLGSYDIILKDNKLILEKKS